MSRTPWKQLMESVLSEGQEIEYYLEDKLLSVALPTGEEANELSFVVTGGSDEDEASSADKQRGVNLLRKTLKLLQSKGYFGDVGEFLSRADVKRKLSAYGLLQAPLTQTINHKMLKRMLIQAGLKVVSATQYDKAAERDLDQEADPEELQRYKDSLKRDDDTNNATLQQDLQKKQDVEDTEENYKKEESMNLARRILHRKHLSERPLPRPAEVRQSLLQGKQELEQVMELVDNSFVSVQELQGSNDRLSDMLEPVFKDLEKAKDILDEMYKESSV